MEKEVLNSKIYDLLIVGASIDGLKVLAAEEENEKQILGIVSRDFPENFSCASDMIKAEILYISYNHGLFTLDVSGNKILLSKQVVLATGTCPDKENRFYPFYYKFEHKKLKGSDIAVVIGNSDKAAECAINLAKTIQNVYVVGKEFKLNCDKGKRLKLTNKKNITWLPQTQLKNYFNVGCDLLCVLTDSFDKIMCSDIYSFEYKVPEVVNTANLLELDETGHIIVNDKNQTTRISSLYAVGECSNKEE